MLKRTPFHDFHVQAGAKLVDYNGWEMPLLYRGIVEEHQQTRNSGSIFDVSHMGRMQFSGKDATRFLDRVLTRSVVDQKVGQSRYSLVCNEAGGVLDDVIISKDVKNWILVCNAGNREKLHRHFVETRHREDLDFDMSDQTESTGMVALQGPKVIERIAGVLPADVKAMKRYHFESGSYMGLLKFTIFRSGYTGEDGVEIIIPAKVSSMAMKLIAGKTDKETATIKPAGLGARDTLRMEAGMPLYGHELTENIDPMTAGLGWAVDLTKDFIGADALRSIAETGVKRRLVGLELEGNRIARQGYPVMLDGKAIGEVTSGTLSPTLGKSIAMAYADSDRAAEGAMLVIDMKGTGASAKVVKLPFYKRPQT
jgi:aminomethyltransferase